MNCFAFILLLVSIYTTSVQAQVVDSLGSVRGILADSMTGKPIPFATISLFQQGKLINGTLTDSLGHFGMKNLSYGTYHLTFSGIGYRSFQAPDWTVNAQRRIMDIGTAVVSQDVKNLKVVTVRGQKPLIEQRVDGITFNVESLPAIAGSDASDVLRKVPLLSVDANGGLSMRGSSRIRVFIDGKPSDIYGSSVADALKSIPGESIVKVDVITHPSARYDAEGTDGVVNIITRKIRTNTTNGNLSSALGNRSENLMGNVQTKYEKWLMKLDGYYQTYWNQNGSVLERQTAQFGVVQKNESRQTGEFAVGGLTVLYSLDSLKTLNVGYRLRHTPNRTQLASDNFRAENGVLLPTFHRDVDTPFKSYGHIFTSGYTETSTDKRKEFSLLGIYFLANNRSGYNLFQTANDLTTYREAFDNHTLNRELIIQADYSRMVSQKGKWEAGGKFYGKYIDSDSQFGIYDFDTQTYRNELVRSNAFSYQSSVCALYVNGSVGVKKWQFTSGVRYERTDLWAIFKQASLSIPSFHNILPNLLISRTLSQKSALKLGYSVKLVRPYFSYLNPTVNNSDSLNVQSGNPYLQPEIIRRYQLSYSHNGTRLFTDMALFFNNNQNSIEMIRTPRPDGVFQTTWQNVGRNQRLGISATFTWKPTPKISLGTTLTVQHVRLESPVMQVMNSGLMRQLVLNYSHKLPKGYSIDFYGFFDAHNLQLQGYRSGWNYYSLTFSKKSANDRFNLSLRLDTPLTPYTFIDEETRTDSFRQVQTTRYQNQNLRLTASYKLGKKEIKSPRMRQAENPE